jgi:fucose 4-O-acetylase-like acetyltransferase
MFKYKSSSTSRMGWIDYAKGIAIVLVVYRHVEFGIRNSGVPLSQWIINLNDMLYSFRMPLFFLLSGLFFQKSIERKGEKRFIVSRINTLLYPYILWALIQITLQIMFPGVANAQRSVKDYMNILIQPRNLDQLWYLFALFNVTLLYLITSRLFKYDNLARLILSLIFLSLAPLAKDVSTIYDILLHYIFFCIGNITASWFFSDKIQNRLSSLSGLLILLPVFILCQYYFLYDQQMNLYLYALIALTGSMFVIMVSFQLEKYQIFPILKLFGHYSLYIYLLHVPIVSVIRYLLLQYWLGINAMVLLVLLILIAIFFSIIIYRLLMKMKMRWLFHGPFVVPSNESKKEQLSTNKISY